MLYEATCSCPVVACLPRSWPHCSPRRAGVVVASRRCASATSRTSRTRRRSSAWTTGSSRVSSAPPGSKTFTFNAGPAAIEALLSGSLDASYIGPNPAINGFVKSRGDAVRIVAGATSGGAFLVVQADIGGPADLRGKQIASPQLGGTQDVALRSWLTAQGFKSDTSGGGNVSVIPQENAQTLERFREGKLAGAWVPEPWASRLVLEGGGKVLVDERDLWPGGQYTTTVLLVRREFLQQHPDRVEALLRGHVEATKWLQQNPEEARTRVNAAIEKLTGKPIGKPVMDRAFATLTFTTDPQMASLAKSADDAAALGLLKLGSVDLGQLYDPALLKKVTQ